MIDYLCRGVLHIAKGDAALGLIWLNVAMELAEPDQDHSLLAAAYLWRGLARIRTNRISLSERDPATHFKFADTELVRSTQYILNLERYYLGILNARLTTHTEKPLPTVGAPQTADHLPQCP